MTVLDTAVDPAAGSTEDPAARARDLLGVSRLTDTSLTRWLHALPGVDQVGAEARAASLGTRSIKTTSKAVSYTHLDVYKRQPLTPSRWPPLRLL